MSTGEARREALELIERGRNHAPIDYHGGCPQCGGNDGMLNVWKDYFCVCRRHLTYWYLGTNIYSSWQHQDSAEWDTNEALLKTYTEVRAIFEPEPPRPQSSFDNIEF